MAKIIKSKLPTSEKTKISDAYELFLGSRKLLCAKATYESYKNEGERIILPYLLKYCDSGYIEDVTAIVIRTALSDYEETHSKGGKLFMFRYLKSFINWYWNEYEIDDIPNPVSNIKLKKVNTPPKEGITREEVDKLLRAAKNQKFPERDIAMLMILCDTGIRLSSLMGLKIQDINLSKSQLFIFAKDQDFHVKSFGASTGRAIRRYLNCLEEVKPEDTFWYTFEGAPLTKSGMVSELVRLCKNAGIKIHRFHDFRRFYGLELYNSTHDIYFVSRALNHKNIEVTKRYLAINTQEDAEIARLYSPMDNRMVTINRKKK